MLKTLHTYLLKDLIKVSLLSLVSITLLMSVLVIIQPLRKLGLAGEQLLQLFLYTIPVMLSLTMPIATLFAGTLVYGRFSQDNELLAAKASGISTLSLLRPALAMGVIVTVLSLAMINVVAPKLSSLAGLVQNNMRHIFFHRLKTRGYVEYGRGGERHVIHADDVDADANALYGIVYSFVQPAKPPKPGEQPKPDGVFMASASAAYLDFIRDPNGDDQVSIRTTDPSLVGAGAEVGPPLGTSKMVQFVVPMENPVRDKTAWYSWTDLLATLKDPGRHPKVRRDLGRIKRDLASDMLAQDIIRAIQAGKSYKRFTQGDEQLEIEAAWAEIDKEGAAVLKSDSPDGQEGKLVTVMIRRSGKVNEIVTAKAGRTIITWSEVTRRPQVTIKLETDVMVEYLGGSGRRVSRARQWVRGEIPVPVEVMARSQGVGLSDLSDDPHSLTSNPQILKAVDALINERIPEEKSDLKAELHVRVAYGGSCFLMVAMGAALGLIFKGGQFISAFALSAVPAAAVIFMLVMGKQIVRNPASDDMLGLACIWGGMGALLVANLVIYARLARK